jgi:hypothetical protein
MPHSISVAYFSELHKVIDQLCAAFPLGRIGALWASVHVMALCGEIGLLNLRAWTYGMFI